MTPECEVLIDGHGQIHLDTMGGDDFETHLTPNELAIVAAFYHDVDGRAVIENEITRAIGDPEGPPSKSYPVPGLTGLAATFSYEEWLDHPFIHWRIVCGRMVFYRGEKMFWDTDWEFSDGEPS